MEYILNTNKVENIGYITGSELKVLALTGKYADSFGDLLVTDSYKETLRKEGLYLEISTILRMLNSHVRSGYLHKGCSSRSFRVNLDYFLKIEDNGIS